MTGLLIFSLVLLILSVVAAVFHGETKAASYLLMTVILLGCGSSLLFLYGMKYNEGYPSNICQSGIYDVSALTVDTTNAENLYFTFRDYKNNKPRLCLVNYKNVHFNALHLEKVRLVTDNNESHIYPAE